MSGQGDGAEKEEGREGGTFEMKERVGRRKAKKAVKAVRRERRFGKFATFCWGGGHFSGGDVPMIRYFFRFARSKTQNLEVVTLIRV